jgi:syntaxin 18
LEECGRFQSDMMEIRLMREIEKSKSVLYKTRNTGPSTNDYSGMNGSSSAGTGSADYRGKTSYNQHESSMVIENQLDPEQLQLFAQENQDMLKQYEDQLDKVRYVSISVFQTPTDNTQRNREVAHRDLGTAIYARDQPQHTVSAHRPAGGGLVQHNG